ncbi:DUF2299 domain-containing protein [Methanobrevibacter sp. UBA212]|jgi:hypothetical protein|uniref:DUF2299 domain-containing protein n=1 Tax=Methanobrevibacter sp. UBA212 TaxID=1915476 RepID=UPI0025D04A87|nr:DUF2299 family protein [Methanobrevibacter sp. UBA212]MEE1150671.1 DUF2299 family protein [Methanobrevibacter sp.]
MNLEENVRQWLSEEDLLREVKYDENADFHYIIEFPKENIMDVVKPAGKDCLIVACATQVAPQHLDLMKQADNKTQKDFIMDLNFGLNNFLVDFELQVAQDILQQFVVTEQIFEDGITKNEFFRTLKRIFKAKLHCIWLIDKTFGSVQINVTPSNQNDMFV